MLYRFKFEVDDGVSYRIDNAIVDAALKCGIMNISNDMNQLNQQQITIDFEAEMMKLLDPVHEEHKKDQNNNKINQSSVPSNAIYLYDGIVVF